MSVYRHHRCYGGPEEGGWWYTRSQWCGGVPFPTREQAEAWLETAQAEVDRMNREEAPARARAFERLPDSDLEPCPVGGDEGYIPRGWDDGGELEVVIEAAAGEGDNMAEAEPHYE